MSCVREYEQYGISKKRYEVILRHMLSMSEGELLGFACQADEWISDYLVESIKNNMSFDRLEKKYGIINSSKSDFYRKRRLMFHLVDVAMRE